MNYTVSNPTKIGCYVQTSNPQAITTVKSKLGADVIVNFQLYSFATLQPAFCLKVDGKVLANDGADYWGYAWNNNDRRLSLVRRVGGMEKYDNFAGSVLIVQNGKAISNPEFGRNFPGVRGRTCVGRKANGDIVLYRWPDSSSGAASLAQLAQKMIALGCVDAINYDGGGSCQMICPAGSVNSSRRVGSFLWFKLPAATTPPASNTSACPFREPSVLVRNGSRGEGAKWVQWQLNRHGAKLTVDGKFGPLSASALRTFQRSVGLVADAICGAATRAVLRK